MSTTSSHCARWRKNKETLDQWAAYGDYEYLSSNFSHNTPISIINNKDEITHVYLSEVNPYYEPNGQIMAYGLIASSKNSPISYK